MHCHCVNSGSTHSFPSCTHSILPYLMQQPKTGSREGPVTRWICLYRHRTGNSGAHLVLFKGLPVQGLLCNKDLEQFVASSTWGPCLCSEGPRLNRVLLAWDPRLWIDIQVKGSKVQQFHELLPTRCFILKAGVGEEYVYGVFLHLGWELISC